MKQPRRGAQERARLEAELRQARSEMLRLARAAAVGELTASMAHEMARPLRAILHDAQAALQLVGSAPPRPEAAGEALRGIVAQAERASEIAERILRTLGRGAADRRPLQLETLIGDVVRLLAREAEVRRVAVEVDAAVALPPVMADGSELRSMLAHVVARALEAASAGRGRGRVQVRVRAIEDGCVRVEVRDSGPGASPEAVASAFEPLFTMGVGGTVSGLALCRAVCEAHGGSLAFEDDGGSSVLAVTLPGRAGPASKRAEAPT